MDDFAAMQTKAKQLVQIYKPAHNSTISSAAILVHTASESTSKGQRSKPKSNQHQLSPIDPTPEQNSRGMGIMAKDNEGKGVAMTGAHVAVAILEIMIIDMRIKTKVQAAVNLKESFQTIEEEVKITRFEGDEG